MRGAMTRWRAHRVPGIHERAVNLQAAPGVCVCVCV